MRTSLNTGAAAALALLEALALLLVSYLLLSWLLLWPWRNWIDLPTVDLSGPFLCLQLVTLLVLLVSRQRYALPKETRADSASTWLTCMLVATLACAFFAGSARFADRATLSLIEPFPLAASIFSIASWAAWEEFIHRRVLLTRLIRAGLPPAAALLLGALLFVLVHGRAAYGSAGSFAWYFVAGLTLGTLFLATRSLWAPTVLHALLNLCMAQDGPNHMWWTQRIVEDMTPLWHRPLTVAWSILVVGYWLWRILAPFYNPPHGCLSRRRGRTGRLDLAPRDPRTAR